MSDRILASSSSVQGMLQRGRGQGVLAATAQADAVGWVLGCVIEDPRWDTQTEERDLYLARLVIDLHAPLGPVRDRPGPGHLAAALRAHVGPGVRGAVDPDPGRLPQRGCDRPREYLTTATGEQCHTMLDHAWEYGDDALGRDLDVLVLDRLTDHDLHALARPGYGPWRPWAERHPRVAKALQDHREQRASPRPARPRGASCSG